MKVRTGFVSNSSSSSFCIYGVSLSESDIQERLQSVTSKDDKSEEDDEEQYFDVYGACEDLFEKHDMKGYEIHFPDGFDEYFVGRSWSNIGDDETGRQFKESIERDLKKLFGEKGLEFNTHEHAWMG